MDASIFRDALTALAGIATGVMSGTFGVGGAVISTPAIRALGFSAALAVGTTYKLEVEEELTTLSNC